VTLAAGHRLGPYEILGPIGAGGMGEVYQAQDLRLKRILAIKILPEAVSAEPKRLRRFEHEARAASALNHPSILSVYDVGTEGSISYIAMEHVDGPTLRELLQAGPLPLRRVLEIAVPIAEGLSAAHAAGIVHRDVKPANVMIARQGFVKILDFGLAKMADAETKTPDYDATTDSVPGKLLGTLAYMSPEQARGGAVDFRSDQFSLGAVLYEMVTGQRAFSGATEADILAAILRQEPEPLGRISPGVPAPLRWVVERCLSKAPADRYASTQDLARELGNLKDHWSEISSAPEMAVPLPRSRRRFAALAAAAVVLTAAAALSFMRARSEPSAPDVDFRRLTPRQGEVHRALFAPNSNAILYTASWDGGPAHSYLTLPESKSVDRSLDADVQLPMAYTEDGSEALVLIGRSRPSINAFGRLAFWPALGGKPRVIMEAAGWSDLARRARFLAVVQEEGPERTLEIRDAAGRKQRTLFRTTGGISYVRVSPDETQVAFIHHPSRNDDAGEVRVVAVAGASESRALSPRFLRCAGLGWHRPTGEVWVSATRENLYRTSLWAFDLEARSRRLYSFPDYFILSDISDRGELLFISGAGGTSLFLGGPGAPSRDYTWLGSTYVTDVSPDGKTLLFIDGGPMMEWSRGSWVRPLDGGDAVRIADGDAGKFSPDGKWVVTSSRPESGPPQLVLVRASGGDIRQVTSSPATHADPSFLDAQTLLFVRSEGQRSEVWRMATDGTQARPLGAEGCESPIADPAGRSFLCIGGTRRNALLVHPLEGGQERRIYDLPSGVTFLYARWGNSGREILAVTNNGRFLTLSPESGLLREEGIALPPAPGGGALLAAAFSADAKVRAYSTRHYSSRLYLCRGL